MATLGRWGVVTLDQARREARRMLGLVAEGKDPLAERDAAKAALPLRSAIHRWLDEHVRERRKPATLRNYKLAVEQHIVPALGAIPLNQLCAADVSKLHNRLKGTPYLANRVVATVSAFCSWSEREGLRLPQSNPCFAVERYSEYGHKRYLSASEYGRLGEALRAAEEDATVSPAPIAAIRLLLLTGCRPSEILTLQWRDVDLSRAVLRLPDSKTGAKTVHLSTQAVKLLTRWPKFAGSPYVFPGTGRKVKGSHLVNLAKPWRRLALSARLDGIRLYDACRHSFASVAISQHGHGLGVIGELLGHSQAATTKRYAHLHDDVAKKAAGEIGDTIATALGAKRITP